MEVTSGDCPKDDNAGSARAKPIPRMGGTHANDAIVLTLYGQLAIDNTGELQALLAEAPADRTGALDNLVYPTTVHRPQKCEVQGIPPRNAVYRV